MEVVEAVTFVEALSVNVVGVTYIQYIYTYKQFGTIWESYRSCWTETAQIVRRPVQGQGVLDTVQPSKKHL